MRNMRASLLYTKVHNWIDAVGFRLNASQTNNKSMITTNHYFFETFNLVEKEKKLLILMYFLANTKFN